MNELKEFENRMNELERVEAPPFLFTRIASSIDNLEKAQFPVQKVLVFACALVVLIVVNFTILFSINDVDQQSENQPLDWTSMYTNSSNQIYHE